MLCRLSSLSTQRLNPGQCPCQPRQSRERGNMYPAPAKALVWLIDRSQGLNSL